MACAECLNSPLPALAGLKWIEMAFITAEPRLHQAQEWQRKAGHRCYYLLLLLLLWPCLSGTRVSVAPFVCNDGSAYPVVQ
jgi:hypothetical protein